MGEYLYYVLKKHEINVCFFCDKEKGGGVCYGVPVLWPKDIGKYSEYCVIISLSGKTMIEIHDYLCKNGIKEIFTVNNLLQEANFNDFPLHLNEIECKGRIEHFLWDNKMYNMNLPDDIRIWNLDLLITDRCSLRCKNCVALIPYYKKMVNYKFDEVIMGVKKLLEYVDEIHDIRIMGGETFLNNDVYDYIRELNCIEKIDRITIFTNATILPNRSKLEDVVSKKLKFAISDYGKKSKVFNEMRKMLDDLGIDMIVNNNDFWYDLGGLKKHEYTDEKVRKLFHDCICRTTTLVNSKLYSCTYSAHGMDLGVIPKNKDDIFDLVYYKKYSRTEVKKKLWDFLMNKNISLACQYCNGVDKNTPKVVPAIQTEKILEI